MPVNINMRPDSTESACGVRTLGQVKWRFSIRDFVRRARGRPGRDLQMLTTIVWRLLDVAR
jgi:hypothetical protein